MPHALYASSIRACYECATACENCAASCLEEHDVKSMARCIALDTDCAAICRLAAAATARGSEFTEPICQLCAAICDACGAECGKHAMDHCQQCAMACQRCAEECRSMTKQ